MFYAPVIDKSATIYVIYEHLFNCEAMVDVQTPDEICEDHYVHADQVAIAKNHLISDNQATRLSETFKALSDPTRIRIIAALTHTELCVYDLTAVLGLTQSAVSHQLRLLRTLRLVKSRRDGRHIYYQLDDTHIHDLFHRGLDHVMHG